MSRRMTVEEGVLTCIAEISARDTRIAALEAQLAEVREAFSRMVALYESECDPDAITRPQWVKDILSALETTPPAPKDPWPVHYANTTAPGRFTPPAPKVTATHRHKKRGSEYVLVGIGKMQAEDWIDQRWTHQPESGEPPKSTWSRVDMREVAIYRSVDDGSLWVRPKEEFEDGRFEALTAAQPAPKVTELDEWEGEITGTSERVSADRNRQARIAAAQEAGKP